MAEEAAVLLELADVSARLRALAASEVFAMVVASLSNEPRAEVIETLRDLESTRFGRCAKVSKAMTTTTGYRDSLFTNFS